MINNFKFNNDFQYNFQSTDHVDNILNTQQNPNGRVNIMSLQPPCKSEQFKMFEKVNVDNKAVDYRRALCGVQQINELSQKYFSSENMQSIQDSIKGGVLKKSNGKYILPNQNVNTLKIIMRSIYLEYAIYNTNLLDNEIKRLNKIVIDNCVERLYNESIAYEKYCYDQSTIAMPMERPKNNDRDYKQLEFSKWM